MKNRLIVGFSLIGAFLFFAWWDNFWANFLIFVLLLVLGLKESLNLFKLENSNFLIITALIFFSFCIFLNPLHALIAMIAAFAGALAFIKSPNVKLILPLLYPAAPIFVLFALLVNCGMTSVIWLVVCVACSDTAAFFTGKYFAKNLPQSIKPLSASSPNKSLQGAIAGLVAGSILGALFASVFVDEVFLIALATSFFVSVFGILGDLFESYLKRLADIKDSGSILGDHGGILDRFDAIFFGAIAMLAVLS